MAHGWVDIASRAIVQVGFPVVVAAVLLWFLLGRFTGDLHYIAVSMDGQLQEMKAHTQALKDQTQLLKEFITEQRRKGS